MIAGLQRPLTLLQPPRIAFGPGGLPLCAEELARQGRRQVVLVTTERGATQAEMMLADLRSRGLGCSVLTSVPPEPDVAAFERLRTELGTRPCDAIVGLGGGSVLDVAKLLAALHGHTASVETFFGIGLLPPRTCYLACLPTTAGTGSEVSPNAILLDASVMLKKGVVSPWLVPDAAFVDPTLTSTVPPALTASTGLDALVHCIEAYANLHAHPLADLYALQGIRLISGHLATAVADGGNAGSRAAVAAGSLYGGLCLGPVNTAAVHALAYPLGGEFRVPHGLANALLLTAVLRFNLPAAPGRYAAIAHALGVSAAGDDLSVARAGLDRLGQLCRDCGLPRGLAAVGIPPAAIPRLAASALTVTRLLRNNPRPLTAADAEAIYHDAF